MVSSELRQQILKRDNWTCRYCDWDMRGHPEAMKVDHVIPKGSRWGGSDDENNLVAACNDCNGLARSDRFCDVDHKRAWIQWARSTAADQVPAQGSWMDHRPGTCAPISNDPTLNY